jgi:hypothetical protein
MGDAKLCFVGHSHVPGVFLRSGTFLMPPDIGMEWQVTEPAIVNIGSVGQPRDGDPARRSSPTTATAPTAPCASTASPTTSPRRWRRSAPSPNCPTTWPSASRKGVESPVEPRAAIPRRAPAGPESLMTMLLRCLFAVLLAGCRGASRIRVARSSTSSAPGSTGSFRAHFFAKDGAGVVWLQATDHYVTPRSQARRRRDARRPGDYLLLAPTAPTTRCACPARAERGVPGRSGDGARGRPRTTATRCVHARCRQRPRAREGAAPRRRSSAASCSRSCCATWLDRGRHARPQLGDRRWVPQESSIFLRHSLSIVAPPKADPQHVPPQAGGTRSRSLVRPLSFAGTTNRFFAAFLSPRDDAARRRPDSFEVDTDCRSSTTSTAPAPTASRLTRCATAVARRCRRTARDARRSASTSDRSRIACSTTLPEPARFAPMLDVDLNVAVLRRRGARRSADGEAAAVAARLGSTTSSATGASRS